MHLRLLKTLLQNEEFPLLALEFESLILTQFSMIFEIRNGLLQKIFQEINLMQYGLIISIFFQTVFSKVIAAEVQ